MWVSDIAVCDAVECPWSSSQLLSAIEITFRLWSATWSSQVATFDHKAYHTYVTAEHPSDCILSFGNPRQRSPAEQGGPDPPPHERPYCEADC